MMPNKYLNTGLLALFVAGAAVAAPARGRVPRPRTTPHHDLNRYSDQQLMRDLNAELQPLYQLDPASAEEPLETLKHDIMQVLKDDSDTEGPASEVDFGDLEAEVEEVNQATGSHLSVEDVVEAGLERADELSLRAPVRNPRVLEANIFGLPPALMGIVGNPFLGQGRQRDNEAKTSVAVEQVAVQIFCTVRKVPKGVMRVQCQGR
jgi:hypothetical protein